MGFRLRRSIRLFPGVRVNLGKRGASLSVGRRGASLTFGRRGTYGNVGLPGTGLSYRTRIGGTPALNRQAAHLRLAPTPAAPARDNQISARLSLDDALIVQVDSLKSDKPLTGKARADFLKRHAAIVSRFLRKEAERCNQERAKRCDPPPLDQPAPAAASADAAAAPLTARLKEPPRSVSGRKGLDRIAAYRRHRSAVLEAWVSARRESAAPAALPPPLEQAVVRALAILRRGDAPSFEVAVAVEPGASVTIKVAIGDLTRLPLGRLVARPDHDGLAEQPLSDAALVELIRLWATTVVGRCCDLLFLDRDEVDRARVEVSALRVGPGDAAAPLGRLALSKGEYVFDVGCGRNLLERDPPASLVLSPVPEALLAAMRSAAATSAADASPARSSAAARRPSRASRRKRK